MEDGRQKVLSPRPELRADTISDIRVSLMSERQEHTILQTPKSAHLEVARFAQFSAPQYDKVTCEICLGEYARADATHSTAQCACTFCKACLRAYLLAQMQEGKFLDHKCVNDACAQKMSDADVRRHLQNDDVYQRYQKYKKRALISRDPGTRWCTTVDCENALKKRVTLNGARRKQIDLARASGSAGNQSDANRSPNAKIGAGNDDYNGGDNDDNDVGDDDDDILVCDQCNARVCFKCGQTAHPACSCDDALDPALRAYYKEKGMQRCPQCLQMIERTAGCNYIVCSVCKLSFCYLCLEPSSHMHMCFGWTKGFQGKRDTCCKKAQHCAVYACERLFATLIIAVIFVITLVVVVIAYHLVWPLSEAWNFFGKALSSHCKATHGCAVFGIKALQALVSVIAYPLFVVLAVCPGYCVGLCKLCEIARAAEQRRRDKIKREKERLQAEFKINDDSVQVSVGAPAPAITESNEQDLQHVAVEVSSEPRAVAYQEV